MVAQLIATTKPAVRARERSQLVSCLVQSVSQVVETVREKIEDSCYEIMYRREKFASL